MRFWEFKEYKKGKAGQLKGKDAFKKSKPGGNETPHPARGKLVGESLNEAKVGREYQHLEDLVFVKGSQGALEAADILEKLGSDSGDVAIKWDGNPTIYWGRDPDGQFVLVGKNGWGKNKSTSSKDLSNFIKNSGKGAEQEPWRKEFAKEMSEIFDVMEGSTPPEFRGYVYGDLLYSPRKSFTKTDGGLAFTPNKVTYTVDVKSDLGKRIANSKVGLVVHQKYEEWGSKEGTPIEDVQELNSKDAVVLGQTYVTHQPEVDTKAVDTIRQKAKKYAGDIDKFLSGVQGLTNPAGIIYTFMNHSTRMKQLDNINVDSFFEWLKSSKISQGQQAKLADMDKANAKALPEMFDLIKQVMTAKDNIINQLDNAESDVKASTAGEKGGEGYVALGSKTKLVPRTRWQPN